MIDFLTEPSNLATFVGAPAKFECSHTDIELETDLAWLLNGVGVFNSLLTINVTSSSDNCIGTNKTFFSQQKGYTASQSMIYSNNLTIDEAIRECNNSVIHCVAVIIETQEITDISSAAILTVHGTRIDN